MLAEKLIKNKEFLILSSSMATTIARYVSSLILVASSRVQYSSVIENQK